MTPGTLFTFLSTKNGELPSSLVFQRLSHVRSKHLAFLSARPNLSYFLIASTASGYNLGFPSMMRDLNATEFQATQGLSMYALGFGILPLVTASFSEEFGRQPLYLWSGIGFLLMYIMVGL